MQAQGKNSRPYVLHRIDKETSGVLVFAKNIKLHSMLKMHWNEQVTLREYFAVVEGILEKKQDTITSFLKENKNNLVYSTNDPTGQKAVTRYEVVKESGEYSLDIPVDICILADTKCLYSVGEGRLIHSEEGFRLIGCDGRLDFVQKAKSSYTLNADYFWYEIGDVICIGNTKVSYYCFPKCEGDVVAKTRLATEELFKLKS